jgi:two-component system, OmpR family, response regulator
MKSSRRIMLVEDDENLGFLIKDYLGAQGWKVNVYRDGDKGLSAFHSHPFDLCILDIMLPSRDGFDLASEIRKYNQTIPIIFLTARSQTEDRIRGFRAGADDYVCKPFSIEEFKYRIEAVMKRAGLSVSSSVEQAVLKAGKSSLDLSNLMLEANGVATQLTYKEAKLLELFFRHCNQLVEREVFLKSVWENDGFFVARSMDVFVSRLRKYLAADDTLRIENIRAVGYVLKCAS